MHLLTISFFVIILIVIVLGMCRYNGGSTQNDTENFRGRRGKWGGRGGRFWRRGGFRRHHPRRYLGFPYYSYSSVYPYVYPNVYPNVYNRNNKSCENLAVDLYKNCLNSGSSKETCGNAFVFNIENC